MRKILFAALAAMVMFASCDKENNDGLATEGKHATLDIKVTAKGTKAASTIAPDVTDDTNVTGFTAFIVNADNSVTQVTSLTASASATVKTDIKGVYVVANASATDFSAIDTFNDLMAAFTDLNSATAPQSATRWATGSTPITPADFVEQPDNSLKATKSIGLTFITGRITLKIATSGTMAADYDATKNDGSLVLENVAVLNARGESMLFGSSLVPASYTASKKFYEGIADASFTNYPAAGSFSPSATLIDPIAANDFSSYYYFYAFENEVTAPEDFPTIITVIGEYDGEKVYYPVHLAPYEIAGLTQSVERGKSYDITVTLTGDPKIGGDGPGGGEDPTDPIVTASFEVSITINNWVPELFNKEF